MKLALDLGTTTLAGRLLDANGAALAAAALENPQRNCGDDIVTRLQRARDGEAVALRHRLLSGVRELAEGLLAQVGRGMDSLTAVAAAANPGIAHLLCGWEVAPLLVPPYRPQQYAGVAVELPGPWPPLFLFPLVNGYVGGDLVAFVYGRPAPSAPTLYLDVGTNAELALFDGRGWQVTSVAAGPAFEGGGISCGRRLGPGAIVAVEADDDRLRPVTADGGPPLGLCGSGLLTAVAAALAAGLIDGSGRILAPAAVTSPLARYLVADGDGWALQLYRDARREIRLTQADVRAFQLAKGALRAGIDCLLARAGLAAAELAAVVITGAFGAALEPAALERVAALPPAMIDRVLFTRDGALAGVCRWLQSDEPGRTELRELVPRLNPYPLSGTPAFERAFLSAMNF